MHQLLEEADVETNHRVDVLGVEVKKLTENMTSTTASIESGFDELMQLLTGGAGAQ